MLCCRGGRASRAVVLSLANQDLRFAAVGFAMALLLVAGCRRAEPPSFPATIALKLAHEPPQLGPCELTVTVTDPQGQPISDVSIQVEGNMNHAGMRPVFAEARQVSPGVYTGSLDFTMAGDWFVLVTAERNDGARVTRTFEVPGVNPP